MLQGCQPSAEEATLYHYRTRDGVEVDALLEAADGRIVAVEVKASTTVRSEDFRHLHHPATRVGDRFHLGIVLHTGAGCASFGPRMWAVPVDRLWRWSATG